MIYFIDQTSEKQHHMIFNSSMLQILLNIYANDQIVYQGVSSSQKIVLEQIKSENKTRILLDEIPISKPLKDSFVFKLLNYFKKDAIKILKFYKVLKQTKENDTIYISITTFSAFLFIKILKKFFKVKTIMILHGDVDYVYNAKSKIEKIIGFTYKLIFKIKAPNFYYLLLNKISKQILVNDGFLKENEVFEIDHPYSFSEEKKLETHKELDYPCIFGHIGSAEVKRKNSHFLYQIAEKFQTEINKNHFQFHLVGLRDIDMKQFNSNLVKNITGNENENEPQYLDRKRYEAALSQLHYAFFFYDKHQYVFRASGAIIDAIAFGIPILVFRHPFFEYLFAIGGNIGYMFNNIDQMEKFLADLNLNMSNYKSEYEIQKNNIQKLKEKFKVDYLSSDLASQIKSSKV